MATPCEDEAVTFIVPRPDNRPDIVIAVYGTGRAEARYRWSNNVIAEEATLAALVLRLVSSFPDGVHLDIKYDPHM